MNKLRKLWESIVYAGMQPSSPASAPRPGKPTGGFRDKLERFLSGGPAPSDPLYLPNRSLWQRARTGILVFPGDGQPIKATSIGRPDARAHMADARVNRMTPDMNTRRAPNFSPSAPDGRSARITANW